VSRNAPRGLLIEGDAFVDQFTQDKVADAQRIRVADLVDVREDPSITAEDAGAPVRSGFFDYVGTPHGVIIRESG